MFTAKTESEPELTDVLVLVVNWAFSLITMHHSSLEHLIGSPKKSF